MSDLDSLEARRLVFLAGLAIGAALALAAQARLLHH